MSFCHLYAGVIDRHGYGNIFHKKYYRAHRVIWENERGNIPKGLIINHLCRNRPCINIEHLELTTDRHNILTGIGASAINARKTHCKRGHEYAGDNMHITAKGWRICRACRSQWQKDKIARRKARDT